MTIKNKIALLALTVIGVGLWGCGFHLRGYDGNYKFPYKTVYLQCDTAVICTPFEKTITNEYLTKLVKNHESAEVTLLVSNEQTSRDSYGFNGTGQISSYLLTYQISAQVFDRVGNQIGQTIVVQSQTIMSYNNSLILSAGQQEDQSWELLHQNVISSLIQRIVYSNPKLVSINVAESK